MTDLTVDWRHELAPLPTADCVTAWHKMGVPEGTGLLIELANTIHGSPSALGPLATALQRGASAQSLLASLSGPTPYRLLPHLDAVERAAFTSALTVYQDLGGRRGQANALYSLAHIDVIFDRRRMALSRLRRTRQLFVELGLANLITNCDRALDEVKQVS
ncbi:hypothetical protein ACFW9N_27720 [Streptomyces sp. NPDC059496]|uniref:hypothetical protein n=1 Tax=Streptomyces sp. NPDC059496 TaxID=3346851 RepID=UPI0036C69C44